MKVTREAAPALYETSRNGPGPPRMRYGPAGLDKPTSSWSLWRSRTWEEATCGPRGPSSATGHASAQVDLSAREAVAVLGTYDQEPADRDRRTAEAESQSHSQGRSRRDLHRCGRSGILRDIPEPSRIPSSVSIHSRAVARPELLAPIEPLKRGFPLSSAAAGRLVSMRAERGRAPFGRARGSGDPA